MLSKRNRCVAGPVVGFLAVLFFLLTSSAPADAAGWTWSLESLVGPSDYGSVSVDESCIAYRAGESIMLFDLDSRASTEIFRTEAKLGPPVVSGNLVSWAAGPRTEPWDVFVYDIASGERVEIPQQGHSPDVSWSRVVFVAEEGIYLYDSAGGQTSLIAAGAHCFGPHISGNYVLWQQFRVAEDWDSVELYVHDIYSGQTRQITSNALYDAEPSLSDRYVAWHAGSADDPLTNEIFLYSLYSGQTYQITHNTRDDKLAQISYSDLAWQSDLGDDYAGSEIFLYNLFSQKTVQLTNNDRPDRFPCLSEGLLAWTTTSADTQDRAISVYQIESELSAEIPLSSTEEPISVASQGSVYWADGSEDHSGIFALAPIWELDDANDSPFLSAIQSLAGRDIVRGFADGTFRPDQPVTRQQFAKMIAKATGIVVGPATSCPFPDVASGLDLSDPLYPDKYVGAAWQAGLIKGYSNGSFGPYDSITRAQAITMVVRAAERLNDGLLSDPLVAYRSTWGNFGAAHQLNARKAEYNGIFDLYDLEERDPNGPISRAEVAQLLDDYLTLIRITPAYSGVPVGITQQEIADIVLEEMGAQPGSDSYQALVIGDHRRVGDWIGGFVYIRWAGGAVVFLHREAESWTLWMVGTDFNVEDALTAGVPPELIDYVF